MTDQPPALLFIPAGFQARPDPVLTRQALSDLGILGQALTDPDFYSVGDGFIDHVSFLGCSPHLKLEPEQGDRPGDASFIHVSLQNMPGELTHRHGRNARPPLCPHCRKPAASIENISATFTCPHCKASTDPVDMAWRDGELVARDVIEIIGIYPREAVPTGHFMAELNRRTRLSWRYVYL